MNIKLFFYIISLSFIFTSCEKSEELPDTEYSFTFKENSNLDIEEFIIFLQFVRVYEVNGNEESIRTLYIGGENLIYQKNGSNEDVFVFTADNDLSKAVAFDFGFDSSSLTIGGLQLGYSLLDFGISNRSDLGLELLNGQNPKLTFELDLENGLIQLENGDYQFLEKVSVK